MATVKASSRRRMTISAQEPAAERLPASPRATPVAKPPAGRTAVPWYRSALALSLVSGGLLWAAFPPLNLGLLAWLAPLGWLALVRGDKLPGKRPYLGIWLAGVAHWLVLLQFMRLPHWSTSFGWVALSLYLGLYPLAFVGLSRVAVHRLRVPLVLAAPILWAGLELLRGYLFTGFSVALLGHAQVGFPAMIQIADLGGCYAVSFVVMFGAACLASMLPFANAKSGAAPRWQFWPALPLAGMLATTLAYGYYRLNETPPHANDGRVMRVALIQGCFPTRFDSDYDDARENFDNYLAESERVCKAHPNLDLVIWPESMFTSTEPDLVIDGPIEPPAGKDAEQFEEVVRSYLAAFKDKSLYAAQRINRVGGKWKLPNQTQLLVGCETQELGAHRSRRYNSALLIDDNGQVAGRYYKMHRVMFGEYVPLGEWFPWLYTLTPMPEGLTPGAKPSQFEVAGLRLAPSICFESTVPHLIRRQTRTLEQENGSPDVLVNVTNDGWFWGSNALDLHLTCGVFRAIEQRRPMLIAANTGFSAVIDGNGKLRERGPRFKEATLVAEVTADGRRSIYHWLGDLPAWGCALVVCLSAAVGCWGRFRRE